MKRIEWENYQDGEAGLTKRNGASGKTFNFFLSTTEVLSGYSDAKGFWK